MSLLRKYLSSLLLFLVILLTSITKVGKVSCEVLGQSCPEEVSAELFKLEGTARFFTLSEELIQQQLPEDSGYSVLTVQKKLPHTIAVVLNPEKVAYRIFFESSNTFATIAESGKLMGDSSQETIGQDLPSIIKIEENISATDFISAHHQAAMNIAQIIHKKKLKVTEIIWKDKNNILLKIDQKPSIIMSEEVLLNRPKVVFLLAGATQLEVPDQLIQEIDARMRLPVLRTKL